MKLNNGRNTSIMIFWLFLAIAGSSVWAFHAGGGEARPWRAVLINFIFFNSLAGGLAVWPAVVRVCNGRWSESIERYAAAGIAFAIPSVAALLLLWFGSPKWAPWYHGRFHQGIWLNNTALFGRDMAGLLLFWGTALWAMKRRRTRRDSLPEAVLVLVYCLVFSLLGMDLVMALDPKWYSTLAGGYFFISSLYIAIAAWAFLASLHGSEERQRHDLGRLVVAFSLMTTYLMYAHLLTFWYENLPVETRFLVPRVNFPPWRWVSFGLLATVYFGPLVLLLVERGKRSRWWLGSVALLVMAGMWIERCWLVTPGFSRDIEIGAPEFAAAVAFLGFLGFGMERAGRRLSMQAIKREET